MRIRSTNCNYKLAIDTKLPTVMDKDLQCLRDVWHSIKVPLVQVRIATMLFPDISK